MKPITSLIISAVLMVGFLALNITSMVHSENKQLGVGSISSSFAFMIGWYLGNHSVQRAPIVEESSDDEAEML